MAHAIRRDPDLAGKGLAWFAVLSSGALLAATLLFLMSWGAHH